MSTEHVITIELSDLEHRAWSVFVADPQEWIEGLVRHEVARSMKAIYDRQVEELLANPEIDVIPASVEAIVGMADLTSAKERDAKMLAEMDGLRGPNLDTAKE